MFRLFSSKKDKPAPLGYLPIVWDMHSHILPGIDDGSPDIATSLRLVRGLYDLGIRRCTATPHIIGDLYRNTDDTIEAALVRLQDACRAAGIPMELDAAAEYMLDDYFMELLRAGKPLRTLHDNFVLTELAYSAEPHNLRETVFNIITAGYRPVLAHPERYAYFQQDFGMYETLKDLGFTLQVNLLSATGYYGRQVARAATYILDKGLAGYLGTDLHHERHLAALQDGGNQRVMKRGVIS